MPIRALIVDDERRARAYLAKLVAAHADVEVVGEARDGVTALEAIGRLGPDLVFLDVQMPEMNGLEVAKRLRGGPCPLIVFTTAYDQFALNAFDLSATDYLLKPYDGERLERALERVRTILRGSRESGEERPGVEERLERLLAALEGSTAGRAASEAEPSGEEAAQAPLTRLPAQARGRIVLLDLDEVYQIASEDRLVFAHTKGERFLLNFSIKELEGRLPADRFFRIHRSSIVNLGHVREVVPWFHGKLLLRLDNGAEATASEERAPRLRAALGLAQSG